MMLLVFARRKEAFGLTCSGFQQQPTTLWFNNLYGQKIETAENMGVPCSRASLPSSATNVSGLVLPYQNGVSGRESRGPIF
jgi:hypothetical protein